VQLTVGELAHGGAALARVDGRVVFVEGAIPGETVEAEVTQRRKDFWRAQATNVLDPADARVTPPCPYFAAGCGGCQLQYVAYPEQLALKRQVLHRQLQRAHLEFPMERIDVLGMEDPWRYRLRGEFHVLRRAGAVSLGFYRKHTYQTLPIDACLIHAEVIERALPAFARAAEDPAADRVTALQFTWAPGTNDLLWAPYPPGSADENFGARAAGWVPELNLNDDSIGIDDAGRHFRVRPETFVQVNARQRAVLYERAQLFAGMDAKARMVDAYAGIGMLTARLAACVHIGATVHSLYHWRGQIETAEETPMAIKTRAALYPRLEAAIRAHHPYELPEIVAVPISDALPGYLDWIAAETVADAD